MSRTRWPAEVARLSLPIGADMHGAPRDPQRYRDQWVEHAVRGQFTVVTPEFSQMSFPRSRNYNLGGVFDLKTG